MTIEIPLTQGMVALIDDDDFYLVSRFKWFAHKGKHKYYARTNSRRADGSWTIIKMHRLLLGLTDQKIHVDHVDGNGLNNRRGNLRACSQAENLWNRGATSANISGFKGVYWHKQAGKWLSQISFNGKHKYLGLYTTPEEAHAAYCAAAKELHGEFANVG